MMLKDSNDIGWHDLRKRIKQWQYACNWIEESDWNLEYAYLQKLQEAIGNWHDLETIQLQVSPKRKLFTNQLDVLMELSKAEQLLEKSIKFRKKEVREILLKKTVAI